MKSDGPKMSEYLRVFYTPSDLRLIKRTAAKQRKKMSQFIREASVAAAIEANRPSGDERANLAAERQLA